MNDGRNGTVKQINPFTGTEVWTVPRRGNRPLAGAPVPHLRLDPAETLGLNDIGQVRLHLAAPLPVEPYAVHRRTGAFLVIDPHDGATLAAGMVRGRDEA